jgi:hypothetical protein
LRDGAIILAPLTVDGGAVRMYLDALDPDLASEGGTALSSCWRKEPACSVPPPTPPTGSWFCLPMANLTTRCRKRWLQPKR